MKNYCYAFTLLILTFLISTSACFSQYTESIFYVEGQSVKSLRKTGNRSEHPVYRSAAYPGGTRALAQYLRGYADCEAMAKQLAVEGKIMISFLIEKDGSVSSSNFLEIKKFSGNKGSDLLTAMPRWIPAQVDGIPVKTKLKIPLDLDYIK